MTITPEKIKELFDKPQIHYKKHWLFEQNFRIEIDKETSCVECIHSLVCDRKFEKRCVNYWFGTSTERGCDSCTNHYSRYDKKPVPCFYCPYFQTQLGKVQKVSPELKDKIGDIVDDVLSSEAIIVLNLDRKKIAKIKDWSDNQMDANYKLREKTIAQILALFPGIETFDELRTRLTELEKKLDDREEDLINAKTEERERIIKILEDYGCGDKGGITLIEFNEKYHLNSSDLSLAGIIEYALKKMD